MVYLINEQFHNSIDSYKYLLNIYSQINSISTYDANIIFDFSKTKVFACNFLSIIAIIINSAEQRNISVAIKLPNDNKLITSSIPIKCFNYYANHKKSFFKPRLIIGNSNPKEVEDLLTKYLIESGIKDYSKLQTLLSELIANIKMHVITHVEDCYGYIASYVMPQEQILYITIVNDGKSIKEILANNAIIFDNDEDALRWALKKTNSTRKDDESGGLGLYLLRKYTYELNGSIIICSGSSIVRIDKNCYTPDNENEILFQINNQLLSYFHGTAITICIPYVESLNTDYKTEAIDINDTIINVEEY